MIARVKADRGNETRSAGGQHVTEKLASYQGASGINKHINYLAKTNYVINLQIVERRQTRN